jgi:hypothetical protein
MELFSDEKLNELFTDITQVENLVNRQIFV